MASWTLRSTLPVRYVTATTLQYILLSVETATQPLTQVSTLMHWSLVQLTSHAALSVKLHQMDKRTLSEHVSCVRCVRSGADSMGHGGTWPPLLQMAGHGGTVSRRTANNKLTKLYTDHHERAHQND